MAVDDRLEVDLPDPFEHTDEEGVDGDQGDETQDRRPRGRHREEARPSVKVIRAARELALLEPAYEDGLEAPRPDRLGARNLHAIRLGQLAEALVRAMTLDEKIHLLHGSLGFAYGNKPAPPGARGGAGFVGSNQTRE